MPAYAQRVGELFLLKPKLLGRGHREVFQRYARDYPIDLGFKSLHTETFEIELPPGYAVDELPAPVKVELPFAVYRSTTSVEGNILKYQRYLEWKETRVEPSDYPEWKKLSARMAAAENTSVVLKRLPEATASPSPQ